MAETLTNHPAWETLSQDWQLVEIALVVEQMHGNVEYHGFSHPLDVVVNVIQEADQYEADHPLESPLDRTRLIKDALTHDVFVDQDLDTAIFPTKEHRSAHVAGYIFREMGDPEEDIQNNQTDIISTNPDYPSLDPHAVVLVRGDIGNTKGPFPAFVDQFINVYMESQKEKFRKGGVAAIIRPEIAAEPMLNFVRLYHRRDLSLGGSDELPDGRCRFVVESEANFARLMNLGQEFWDRVYAQLLAKL